MRRGNFLIGKAFVAFVLAFVCGSFVFVLKFTNNSKIPFREICCTALRKNSKRILYHTVYVCHGFYYDWVGKRHPPGGTNSDRMALAALSHSLLTSRRPPNHGAYASTRLQTLVFPPDLGTSKGEDVDLVSTNWYSLTTLTD